MPPVVVAPGLHEGDDLLPGPLRHLPRQVCLHTQHLDVHLVPGNSFENLYYKQVATHHMNIQEFMCIKKKKATRSAKSAQSTFYCTIFNFYLILRALNVEYEPVDGGVPDGQQQGVQGYALDLQRGLRLLRHEATHGAPHRPRRVIVGVVHPRLSPEASPRHKGLSLLEK